MEVAKALLDDLVKQMNARHIVFDISDLPFTTPAEVNIARQRLESIMAQTDEISYADEQRRQWKEISDYMTLLIKGGGRKEYDEDHVIEVPKDETPLTLSGLCGERRWRSTIWLISLMRRAAFELKLVRTQHYNGIVDLVYEKR